MEACKLSPRPASPIKLVAAGQSDRGMEFAARYCDFNFALGEGVNEPTKAAGVPARMLAHAQRAGRDVGSYMLYMVIADETDEAAMAKWDLYNQGADLDALEHLLGKVAEDTAPSVGECLSKRPNENSQQSSPPTLRARAGRWGRRRSARSTV
jgi:pyrimidine oxygenase